MSDDHDPLAEIERLDRFFDGDEEGERPIDVLRASGVSIPDERDLDDATLHARLWELIRHRRPDRFRRSIRILEEDEETGSGLEQSPPMGGDNLSLPLLWSSRGLKAGKD
ncbi:MAG TPA: hypothetical protein VNN25_03050 [Thermoanaerobaculia bacterium]|nr:hypothetical protein [Thermoanaerobaculia bacterium]